VANELNWKVFLHLYPIYYSVCYTLSKIQNFAHLFILTCHICLRHYSCLAIPRMLQIFAWIFPNKTNITK